MTSIATIAAQGLAYQTTRLAVAASNIVNAGVSAPAGADGTVLGALYRPQTVIGVSTADGGLRAAVMPLAPAARLVLDPASPTGFSALPNVDVAVGMVTLMTASSSYRAATRLIAVDQALADSLTRIIA